MNQLVATQDRPRMLDVGCAHGWFIELNRDRYDTVGIEPDLEVAEMTRRRGVAVREGFFPDVVGESERFDVIVFNDVLEHIPDINGSLEACWKHLNENGVVVINAPTRKGILYKISKVMARMGLRGPFDRLWQKGLPSPHVHYLDTQAVNALAKQHRFTLDSRIDLPSLMVEGLYDRIRYAGNVGVMKAAVLTIAIAAAFPLIKMLPSDIEVWFLRKSDSPPA